jgi:hypothetical protein
LASLRRTLSNFRGSKSGFLAGVLAVTAAILILQLLVPPVIGLADQGDFARVIGKFGYGPAPTPVNLKYAFVPARYVRDPSFAVPSWEHMTSEYLFVAAAFAISRGGAFDVRLIGIIHGLAFLAAFAQLLWVTRNLRGHVLLWIAAVVAFTDAGYVAYWNSFYTEPASLLFFLLLLGETIGVGERGVVTPASLFRWVLWAALWMLAKPQNAPLAVPLVLLLFRLRVWPARPIPVLWAAAGAGVILATAAVNVATLPGETRRAPVYDMVFMAVLPESKNPSTDLAALGLNPELVRYSGTGAWSAGTAFADLKLTGAIGTTVTSLSVCRFYLMRPARLWKHLKSVLPRAMWLRPEWCGNFELDAGFAPGARSTSFSLWSHVHERALTPLAKPILLALVVSLPVTLLGWRRLAGPARRRGEIFVFLTVCCLVSFFVAAFGDAWDTVKHLCLFNFLLDAWLLFAVGATFVFVTKGPQNGAWVADSHGRLLANTGAATGHFAG